MDEDEEFRISIAGAQEKTAFLYWKKKWHILHGTTATMHIMKPQIGMLPNSVTTTGDRDRIQSGACCKIQEIGR